MKLNFIAVSGQQKKVSERARHLIKYCRLYQPFILSSEETDSFFLPFALLEASTLLPLGVDILSLKPCLLALFLLDG